jgi:hypothetical protein
MSGAADPLAVPAFLVVMENGINRQIPVTIVRRLAGYYEFQAEQSIRIAGRYGWSVLAGDRARMPIRCFKAASQDLP